MLPILATGLEKASRFMPGLLRLCKNPGSLMFPVESTSHEGRSGIFPGFQGTFEVPAPTGHPIAPPMLQAGAITQFRRNFRLKAREELFLHITGRLIELRHELFDIDSAFPFAVNKSQFGR